METHSWTSAMLITCTWTPLLFHCSFNVMGLISGLKKIEKDRYIDKEAR